jgi:LysR family transcriptional regulator, hydrogen peroxide-inducible genes activator
MEIHQLRYFAAVADEGSFSRAAAREHVAQPSLSQQIQKLEAELGEKLFDRLPKSVVLTEAGSCLREFARKILINIADARRCVDDLKRDITGRLVVGAIPTISPYVLPDLIAKFQQRHPKVIVEILEDTTESLALRLEDGTLDAAIMSNCDESLTLQRHSLGKEALLLLLPAGHHLARKRKRSGGAISNRKSFFFCRKCIASRPRFMSSWRPINSSLNRLLEAPSWLPLRKWLRRIWE